MKYKVGDKVRIKSLDWYNENKNKYGNIICGYMPFTSKMSIYCGEVLTICDIKEEFSYYHMEEIDYDWTDEMIEGLVEEESIIDLTVKGEEVKERIEIAMPEGYEYVIESGKIIFTKKKKEYPKTYEECCKVMDYALEGETIIGYKASLLRSFQKLLVCRDAYWKIYGEESGLGKPWEPDCNGLYFIPAIIYRTGFIQNIEVQCRNAILSFPTPEMRDAFKENFKEEIEKCKELL